ncbi:DUF3383 family protein [Brevibacillus reuszeri]|uniref:DUF3383 family protein n=1 Tax=Brevibacillus reuszeri TaxID=54915 RepID=UPI00289AA239|nr:DUF3383 family protein [Brevibacillus reuszeri]
MIDIQRPTPRVGFGKPLIIGSSTAGQDYKNYADIDAIKKDFTENSEVYKAAFSLFNQEDNSPAEIAVMLRKTEDNLADFLSNAFKKDWYFLVSTSSTLANITAIADAVEQNNSRQFFASTSSKADLAVIKDKKYSRTTIIYHETVDNYPEAAWIGEAASAAVGSLTWKFKTLKGIQPMDLDATELNEIHELGANAYVTKAGDDVTSEGRTVSGEFIDIIHSRDFLTFSIEYAVQKLLNRAPKIGYDDTGISQIESTVRTVLQRADNQGMIAKDADGIGMYGTKFKSRQEVDAADREAREYNDGEFFFENAGAIHKARIRGLIKL